MILYVKSIAPSLLTDYTCYQTLFPWKDEELLQSFEVFLRVTIVEYCCVVFALPHARLQTNLRTLILLKVGV